MKSTNTSWNVINSISASSLAASKREMDEGWDEYYAGEAELDAGRKELWIQFPNQAACLEREPELLDLIADSDGKDPVVLYAAAEKSVKRLPAGRNVNADQDLVVRLEQSFGKGNVKVVEKRIENIRRMK